MKNSLKLLLAATASAGAAALYVMWPQSEIAPATPPAAVTAPAQLQQGARIVALGDCMVCHTAQGGSAYAGGLPLRTPFGTIYSTNITPDPDTGIGRWSYAAFERAMRKGVSRDGHLLYPAFPYIHYTQMTDADLHAAYDYLLSRTPVRAPPRANELLFPLGFRPLLAGWNLLFLRPGNQIAEREQAGIVMRGKYLVDSLGHCASCHSGLNPIGGESSPAFGGGHIDGWDAPSLIRLKELAVPWTEADLFDYLHSGMSRAHGAAKGPMQPVVAHLSEVPAEDVHAIVAYLNRAQQAGSLAPATLRAELPAALPPPAGARLELRRQGAVLFAAACAACHSDSAPMTQVTGNPGLKLGRSTTDNSPNNFLQTVLAGVPLKQAPAPIFMPPFADVLTDAQIESLAAYVRGDIARRPEWPTVKSTLATLRKGE